MVQEVAIPIETDEPSDYGLRRNALSQWGTLAQSLSSIAPTASPAMVIPLVIAVSGPSSWLVYLVATVGVALVALHINIFAGSSSSPGSLYVFVHQELGLWTGLLAGWALLIAYIGTASAVIGGLLIYAQAFSGDFGRHPGGAVAIIALSALLATALAYRNVELSAHLMLWIEAASIALILLLLVYPGHSHRLSWDPSQFARPVFSLAPIRAGLILATFSFVGFESATALGGEARSPLRTIPRAVLGTAVLAGLLFIFASYSEVAPFNGNLQVLSNSSSPLQLLAELKDVKWLSPLLSIGAIISFFACTLACITAAARAALVISTHGGLPAHLSRTHAANRTPHLAVVASGIAVALPAAAVILWHASAFDLYGWVGTIATLGFVTAYLLVVLAALVRLHHRSQTTVVRLAVGAVTLLFLGFALFGSLNLSAPGPERWLTPIYGALLVFGMAFTAIVRRFQTEQVVSATQIRSEG
jgi:amino acid transporter